MINYINKIKKVKLSISVYLTILITIVTTLTIAFVMWFMALRMNDMISNLKNDIDFYQSKSLSFILQTISNDTEIGNYKLTGDFIREAKDSNLIEYLYLIDENTGEVVFGKDDYSNLQYVNRAEEKSMRVNETYKLVVGIPLKGNEENFSDNFFEILANIILLAILAGFVTSVVLTPFISKPLENLSDAAKTITDGNFDVRIKNSNFLEINDLIYSYNEMAFQLSELYSSLELKVQERTIALETANLKLQETQAMMVHSEKMRSLGELVAGIAHEINNPVNFIHGNIMILQNYADDLLRLIDLYEANNVTIPDNIKAQIEELKKEIDLDFLRDDIKDLIKSCIEGTQRTKNIVLDLKNFSRMEEMVLTQFDIPKEIDTTLNILNNKYKNRITVIKNYSQDTPKIEAYGGQLNQVFMNILDNAQDAIENEGTVTINTYKQAENVVIEFIDSGKGISKEHISKVFDPFFTTKAVGKGTGLGMSISYRVINDHQGTINVDSEVGKGTKFTITLPIAHQKKEQSLEEQIIKDLREENGVVG